ncbi:MAG: anthranilate phosphoribosyltransferase [Bacteroidales bacterium]
MKTTLETLFSHHRLTKQKAKELLLELAKGTYNDSQMASFLTVYRMRNMTVDELNGFREAMLELSLPVDFSDFNTIDLCGTGGDGKNTFNISTLSSFVAAGAGLKVAKHGNYSVSSACGSSNVLEYFGYSFSNSQDKLRQELDKCNICFLHAPLFHPAMKNVAPVRKELGVKTFFNMLGPLVNPSDPQNQLIGVFSSELCRLYNYLYQNIEKNYMIVHSLDGYDEISLTGSARIESSNGSEIINAEEFTKTKFSPEDIAGGIDVSSSAKIFLNILNGNGTKAQNEVVIVNTALAIQCYYPDKSREECLNRARKSLLDKEALKVFKKLIEMQP